MEGSVEFEAAMIDAGAWSDNHAARNDASRVATRTSA